MNTIGDTNRDGTLIITDTTWDSNGTLRVTIGERYGMRPHEITDTLRASARRLARTTLPYPHTIQATHLIRERYCRRDGSTTMTLLVTRLTDTTRTSHVDRTPCTC